MIASSQNDFEEFGVDSATLDELKQVCVQYVLCPGSCSPTQLHSPFFFISDSPLRCAILYSSFPTVDFAVLWLFGALQSRKHCSLGGLLGLAESGAEYRRSRKESGRPQYLGHFL